MRAAISFSMAGLLAAALGATGCFSPRQPACAFSCAVDHRCPTHYVCASDGFCHRADGLGECALDVPDGAADAADDAAAAQDGAAAAPDGAAD